MNDVRRSQERLEDLRRSERAMTMVRWIAAPWALLQIVAYDALPYPPGARTAGLVLVALLVAGNSVVHIAHDKTKTVQQARVLALSSLSLDVVVVSGIVWLYAFDPGSALWAVLFILPLEGAIRFQLRGALGTWIVATLIYTGREIWASDRYGRPIEWNSITFRMGIGLLIAIVAGLMARDLVRQRTQLSEALVELQRIDAIRQGLVSTLAHDVRNPLTVIRGVSSTLLKSGERMEWDMVREILGSADRQAERLQRLATDLLDLARLEAGKLTLSLEPTDLADTVRGALSFADPNDDFKMQVEPEHRVLADRPRLEQVIVNLVANALRYGDPPYVVAARRNAEHVELMVEDSGPGVPADEQAYLFEPFRAESDTTSVGFGLAIVKALTEAQGGRVDYVERDVGACFRVSLHPA